MTAPIAVCYVPGASSGGDGVAARLEGEAGDIAVDVVASVRDCLDRLAAYDCVVSGYDLEEGDGLALLEAVRETHPDLPFVLWTDAGSEAVASRAISAGVTDYGRPADAADSAATLADKVEAAVTTVRDRSSARDPQRRRYETVVEALSDAVYVLDADGRFTYVNDAFVDLVGYDEGTILGSDPSLIKDEVAVERAERYLGRLLSAGGATDVTFEIDIQPAEGEPIVCEDHMGVLPYDGECFDGSVGTLRDVSERKEREQELRWLRRVAENAAHAIYMTTPDGTITYVNATFEEMTGYSRQEVIGRSPSLLDSGVHDEDYFRRLWETVTADEVWEEEIVNERKDGRRYTARQYIVPITDPDGALERLAAFQVDISEQKERERHLERLDRMLRHNLRNDLNVIRGRARDIAASCDGTVETAAERIAEKSDQILNTAEKERTVANILAEGPDRERFDVASLVRTVADAVAADHPDATVQVDAPERADAVATEQIGLAIEELLTNAVVHTDRGPATVTATVAVADAPDGDVRVEIEDDNAPIPEMESRLLTDGKEIGPLYHGTGLGVWLVYLVVSRSGGSVSVRTREPRGNSVRVDLPRAD
jgi:PAS domain S-box-containing protein